MVRANADKATVDFETRSACSLKSSGAWKYSLASSTEVLCLVYRLPHWSSSVTALWTPAFPQLALPENVDVPSLLELFDWIESGMPIEAHNSWFERAIWQNILAPRHGFPLVPENSWRCSAAKAASHALPRPLKDAGAALRLATRKDDDGHKLMMKLSKPRKPRKKERESWALEHGTAPMPLLWWGDLALFQKLWAYCRQDVLAEEALSHALPDLSPQETTYYCLDQRMNQRGFQLDMEGVRAALSLIASETTLLNGELTTLTNGAVTKATQRDKMKAWLATQGLHLDDTQGATLDAYLAPESMETLSAPARRALEILRTLGRSSTAKYETMLDWAGPDGRVRGGLLYHGASTGRWSGAGVQPHNFPKGTIKGFDMEEAWRLIKAGDRNGLLARYNSSVMEVLACALRGAIVAGEGAQLYVADYASIEARVLLWLAREESALQIFRDGGDIYCDMAASIYDRPVTKNDKPERGMGKIAILGLGYQMGASKFQATCANFGITIDDEFATQVVDAYRSKYHRVKQLWWDTEDAAKEAVSHKGHVIKQDRISWQRLDNYLYCTLPSGRRLAYPEPELRERATPWGAVKMALTFKGINTFNRQWERQGTYGGSLVENCLVGETPVLTHRGWVPLVSVLQTDKVWDGIEFVSHDGVVAQGLQDTILVDGIGMTPDHLILTTEGWRHGANAQGLYWAPCRRPHYSLLRGTFTRALALGRRVCAGSSADLPRSRYSDDQRLLRSLSGGTGAARSASSPSVGQHANQMLQSQMSCVSALRRTWDYSMRKMGLFCSVLSGYVAHLSEGADARPYEQRWGVRTRELPMGHAVPTASQHVTTESQSDVSEDSRPRGPWVTSHIQSILPGPTVNVYDIRNCGPRLRFVVAGGRIVHNCVQAISRDIMAAGLQRIEESGTYTPLLSVHDEAIAEAPLGQGSVREFERLLTALPKWGAGCPIGAEGFVTTRYRK